MFVWTVSDNMSVQSLPAHLNSKYNVSTNTDVSPTLNKSYR